MWIISAWIILFVNITFLGKSDATLLFVNEKRTYRNAWEICRTEYDARLATRQLLRHEAPDKLRKCIPHRQQIWFSEFPQNSALGDTKSLNEYQEVWEFNMTGFGRELVSIDSHHYFLCFKGGDISRVNGMSTIVCNDELMPVAKTANHLTSRITPIRSTYPKKKVSVTTNNPTTSSIKRSSTSANLTSTDLITTVKAITPAKGGDISRMNSMSTYVFNDGLVPVTKTEEPFTPRTITAGSTHSSTVMISVSVVFGVIGVILLSLTLRVIHSQCKKRSTLPTTHGNQTSPLDDSEAVYSQIDIEHSYDYIDINISTSDPTVTTVDISHAGEIYELASHVSEAPVSNVYQNKVEIRR